jgi:hypothetical protein
MKKRLITLATLLIIEFVILQKGDIPKFISLFFLVSAIIWAFALYSNYLIYATDSAVFFKIRPMQIALTALTVIAGFATSQFYSTLLDSKANHSYPYWFSIVVGVSGALISFAVGINKFSKT